MALAMRGPPVRATAFPRPRASSAFRKHPRQPRAAIGQWRLSTDAPRRLYEYDPAMLEQGAA